MRWCRFVPVAMAVVGFSLLSGLSLVDRPWLDKPEGRWTLEETEKVLWESPWVERKGFRFFGPYISLQRVSFFVRIQSARPVRLAQARMYQLRPEQFVRDVSPVDEEEVKRLAERLRMEGELVVSMTAVPPYYDRFLDRHSYRTLKSRTSLTIDDNRQVDFLAYVPPREGPNRDAWFRFARPELENARKVKFKTSFGIPHEVEIETTFNIGDWLFDGELTY